MGHFRKSVKFINGGFEKNFYFNIYFVNFNKLFLVKSASEFISSLSSEASEILSSKLSDEEKIIRLKEIGKRSVDIDGVGLYTLGKYRKNLNENQKKQYKELFNDYF